MILDVTFIPRACPDRSGSPIAATGSSPPFWELEALLHAGWDRAGALAQLAARRPEPGSAAWAVMRRRRPEAELRRF